jgi:hypothetical protein
MSKFITLLDAAYELAGLATSDDEINRWLDILEQNADVLFVSRVVNSAGSALPGGISYIAGREDWQISRARFDKWCADQGLIANASGEVPIEVPERKLKREALEQELQPIWATISRDLRDGASNGLSDAAKVPNEHGYWFVERAKAWAEKRGKLKEQRPGGVAGPFDMVMKNKP